MKSVYPFVPKCTPFLFVTYTRKTLLLEWLNKEVFSNILFSTMPNLSR